MRTITAIIATLGVLGVVIASTPARADDDDYGGGRRHEWREHQWREHERREQQRREHEWREHEWREHGWHAEAPPLAYYVNPPRTYYIPQSYSPQPSYAAPGISIGFDLR
jgi:hypothetical protein